MESATDVSVGDTNLNVTICNKGEADEVKGTPEFNMNEKSEVKIKDSADASLNDELDISITCNSSILDSSREDELQDMESLEIVEDKVTIDEFTSRPRLAKTKLSHDQSTVNDDELSSSIDLLEVDRVGLVDDGLSGEEIQLSSDEEGDPGDVALLCLKRPTPVEKTIECLEILDSDEEFPVCLVENEKNDHINIEEKKGFIKEYIETEGLGVIFSRTFGLVLFHLTNVWVNGQRLSLSRTRELLKIGSQVSFYDQSFRGEEFSILSSEGIFHQAVVVWTGDRPAHLMKKVDNLGEDYIEALENSRKTFMLYLKGEVFLRCALVRVKGKVVGYLNNQLGILECMDQSQEKFQVFFSTDDVLIFKKPLRMFEDAYDTPATRLLPVGLNVSVDARTVRIQGAPEVRYQAMCVLAGSWPSSPYPTLLPGGKGSYSEALEMPPEGTFYYLELALEAKLERKLQNFKDILEYSRGNIVYDWRDVNKIRSMEDTIMWREQFIADAYDRPKGNNYGQKHKIDHVFKVPPPKMIKTKRELDEVSSVATAGGSDADSISSVSSTWSRPRSRQSDISHSSSYSSYTLKSTKTKMHRTWYSQENWGYGGLRIKTEIKTEDGEGSSKRIKRESEN